MVAEYLFDMHKKEGVSAFKLYDKNRAGREV